jgi:RNA polymerase sigma-70 factor (ECF subfamily)
MKTQVKAGRRLVAEAIREFAQGPEQAQLEGLAYNLCRNAEEARELVQEACFRALKGRTYDPRRPLGAWLTTTVRNICADLRRRASWRDVSLDAPAPEGDCCLAEALVDGLLPVGQAMESEEARRVVRAALASLPEHHRQVVELCDLEGVSYDAAARRLGIRVGTLRSRLVRARARLRRSLESY